MTADADTVTVRVVTREDATAFFPDETGSSVFKGVPLQTLIDALGGLIGTLAMPGRGGVIDEVALDLSQLASFDPATTYVLVTRTLPALDKPEYCDLP